LGGRHSNLRSPLSNKGDCPFEDWRKSINFGIYSARKVLWLSVCMKKIAKYDHESQFLWPGAV
jgi:hypothetical protein